MSVNDHLVIYISNRLNVTSISAFLFHFLVYDLLKKTSKKTKKGFMGGGGEMIREGKLAKRRK